jgi:hypothetical protein
VDEGQREALHPDALEDGQERGGALSGELQDGMEVEDVVEGADEGDERGAGEDPLPARLVERQPERGGHEDAAEDRQPAEPGRRPVGQPAAARLVDRAHPPGDPPARRGEPGGHQRRHQAGDRGRHARGMHRDRMPRAQARPGPSARHVTLHGMRIGDEPGSAAPPSGTGPRP